MGGMQRLRMRARLLTPRRAEGDERGPGLPGPPRGHSETRGSGEAADPKPNPQPPASSTPAAPEPTRRNAKQRLLGFLRKAAAKAVDVGEKVAVEVLTKYLDSMVKGI